MTTYAPSLSPCTWRADAIAFLKFVDQIGSVRLKTRNETTSLLNAILNGNWSTSDSGGGWRFVDESVSTILSIINWINYLIRLVVYRFQFYL